MFGYPQVHPEEEQKLLGSVIRAGICLAILALAGCSQITTPHLVGPQAYRFEPEDWEGTWVHATGDVGDKEKITVRAKDAAGGVLLMHFSEEKNGKQVEENRDIWLRSVGEGNELTFACVLAEPAEAEGKQRYLFMRVRREGESLIVWRPEMKWFEDQIKKGLLKGEKNGDVLALEQIPESVLNQLLAYPEAYEAFDYRSPGVFYRVDQGEQAAGTSAQPGGKH